MNKCAGIWSHRAQHLNTELHYEPHSYPKSDEMRWSQQDHVTMRVCMEGGRPKAGLRGGRG